MTNIDEQDPSQLDLPDHELFETERWENMLISSSYYFAGKTQCVLNEEHNFQLVSLTVLCSLKNYGNEIEKFLDWIPPYVIRDRFYPEAERINEEDRLFVGYTRNEEDIDPYFIYFTKDAVKFVKPEMKNLLKERE